MRLPRHAQIDGPMKWTTGPLLSAPRGPQFDLEIEVEVGRVDADERGRCGSASRSAPELPCGCLRSPEVMAQHLDVATHRELVDRPVGAKALGDHPRTADAVRGEVPRTRCFSGASNRPASRSPDASPATIAIGTLIARRCRGCGPALSGRCRESRRPRKALELAAASPAASPPSPTCASMAALRFVERQAAAVQRPCRRDAGRRWSVRRSRGASVPRR